MHGALGGLVPACYPIDTLMIANIALHANEAELQTAFGSVAGYKRSRVVNNGKSCTAWVQFEDVLCAEAAMRTLQGSSTLAFDALGLRIAFSKKPMAEPSRSAIAYPGVLTPAVPVLAGFEDTLNIGKRGRDAGWQCEPCVGSLKKGAPLPLSQFCNPRVSPPSLRLAGYVAAADPGHTAHYGILAQRQSLPHGAAWHAGAHGLIPALPVHWHYPVSADAGRQLTCTSGTPIDTLMIANMSPGTNIVDVQTVMNGFAGYKRSRVVNNGKSCTAWVQFEDVLCAEAAMRTLQGSSTLAFDALGLRIAFSKKPMAVTDSASSSTPAPAHTATAASYKANPPIDTLIISSMSLRASDTDIRTMMNGFAGYKRSRVVNNGKSCTAWVQFEDVLCAEAAMRTLQGSSTLAFDALGLRIAFSKNSMGARGAQTSR